MDIDSVFVGICTGYHSVEEGAGLLEDDEQYSRLDKLDRFEVFQVC